jgi:hypothetical protein
VMLVSRLGRLHKPNSPAFLVTYPIRSARSKSEGIARYLFDAAADINYIPLR